MLDILLRPRMLFGFWIWHLHYIFTLTNFHKSFEANENVSVRGSYLFSSNGKFSLYGNQAIV